MIPFLLERIEFNIKNITIAKIIPMGIKTLFIIIFVYLINSANV